jgi:ribose transport system substrate-binding protein
MKLCCWTDIALGAGVVALLGGTLATAAGERIGFLMKERTSAYWLSAEQGAKDTAAANRAELIVKGGVSVTQVAAQAKLLDVLSQEPLNALVISALSPEHITEPLKAMAAKGVKIVAIDVPLPGVANVFVGQDQVGMGETAARFLASIVGDDAEVAIFKNNAVDLGVIAREKRALEVLRAAHPSAKIDQDVYAAPESGVAIEHAGFLLKTHPDVAGVFASTTASTMAMLQALRDSGRAGKIKLVGFGTYLTAEAMAALEDGTLAGWLAQEPRQVGVKGVETALALLRGQSTPSTVYAPYLLVTKANLHEAPAQALLREK